MSDRMRLMMSDRIVYVCGCDQAPGRCMYDENHEPGGLPWDSECVGVVCRECGQTVQAINIDQLIRERDELRGSKDQLMVALEAVDRLQAENERLRVDMVRVADAVDRGAESLSDSPASFRRAMQIIAGDLRILASKEHE